MSETEKSKPKDSPSTSTTTSTVSSSSAVSAANKVSSSIGSGSSGSTNAASKSSSSSSSGFASSGVSSSTSCSMTKHPCKPPPPLPPPPPPGTKHHHHHHHMLNSAATNRARVLYPTAASVKKAFVNLMKDPECLDKATDYLYESLIEDAVMGVYLEVHHAIKSGSLEAIEGKLEDGSAYEIVDTPNYDVFGMSKAPKPMDCVCPNCDRLVATSRFAPHLEKCMGMGRKTSRTASRRLANAKEGNSSYFSSNVSDDEDDADWSSEKRRKKIQSSRTNGSKKNGKSS